MMRINDRTSNLVTAAPFVALLCCFSVAEGSGTQQPIRGVAQPRQAARTRSVLVRTHGKIEKGIQGPYVEVVEPTSTVPGGNFSPFVHASPSYLEPSPAPCLDCGHAGCGQGGCGHAGCGQGGCGQGGCGDGSRKR